MRQKSYCPAIEVLEDRNLPSGILPPPVVEVENLSLPPAEILPGANGVVLASINLEAIGNNSSRLDELVVLPYGLERLAHNVGQFMLRADLDGQSYNGCETVVAYAQADRETDVVDFRIFRPVWVTPYQSVRLEVVADFYGYLNGDRIGVQTAQAVFRDVWDQEVDSSRVYYAGVSPILHHMKNHVLQVVQWDRGDVGVVDADQKNVTLLELNIWSNAQVFGRVTFMANQGSLQNAQNYRLVHTNWDGSVDKITPVEPINERLFFWFSLSAYHGGNWSIVADISPGNQLVGSSLQLAFATEEWGMYANDLDKGEALEGFILNGQFGQAGQLQLWAQPHYATVFVIHHAPLPPLAEMPDVFAEPITMALETLPATLQKPVLDAVTLWEFAMFEARQKALDDQRYIF
ncbi:MAG TPA: hypothetical protein VI937_02175 [Negativicutes bacterium]|nr:hypothetical protein [Negativicutes bacterium]